MRKLHKQLAAQCNNLLLLIPFLLLSFAGVSQAISGMITDGDKKPISKVSVHVKGTSRTTSTDESGKFNIAAARTDVLVFTYVGYVTQEVPLGGRQSVNVA